MKRVDLNKAKGQHINVYLRIRPFNKQEIKSKSAENVSIQKGRVHVRHTYWNKVYDFEHIFSPKSDQVDVFNVAVEPLIHEVLKGYNCTIFAYGQTGSGKTHTIVGEEDEKAGIIPRSVEKIFELLEQTGKDSSVLVSFLELYNEELFDLLSLDSDPKNIRIFEDKERKNSVLVHGLEEVRVLFKDEVYQLLERGYAKRRTAATLMNANSSRSHTVFTIIVHMREKSLEGEDMVKTGKLNLVDLAGSENIGKSGSVDKRAREAGSINQSLLTLGRVIKALTENTMHVPYRESKLTRILQDSLGGRAKTSLIATISSAHINLDETISTLEYATRVKSIQNRPEVNLQISRSALVKEYQEELKKLKSELQSCLKGGVIYVNEENYKQMITDKENFSSEVDVKNAYIQNLEKKLAEIKQNLAIVEKSWTDAANHIEILVRAKKLLEEDLIATNDQKEQDKAELECFRTKQQKLKENTKMLVSTAKIQSTNEGILHDKVNFLYSASHNNVTSLKNFSFLFDNMSTKMISIIDECLQSCGNLSEVKETNANFKITLNESHNTLMKNIQKLSVVWCGLDDFKNNQSNERIPIYLKELERVTDSAFITINATLMKISSILSENVHQMIQEISTESSNRYRQFIVDTLCRLRDHILSTNQDVSALVNQSQEKMQAKFKQLQTLNQTLNDKLAKHERLVQEMDTEGNEKLDHLLNLLDKFQKKYGPAYSSLCEELEENAKAYKHKCDLNVAISSAFIETMSTLKNKIEPCTLQIQTDLGKEADVLKVFKQEDFSRCNSAVNLVEKNRMNMQESVSQITKAFKQIRENVSVYGENVLNKEKVSRNLAQTMNESQQNVIDTISSASIKVDDTYETLSDVFQNAESSVKDSLDKMMSVSRSYEQYSEEMKRETEKFCNLLVPPAVIHAEDSTVCKQKTEM